MNYGQIRDRALQLIDQYSVAGQTVALSYNNQADYVKKIPALINRGLELISTTYRRIRDIAALPTLSRVKFGENTAYVLPKDCWQMGGLSTFNPDGGIVRWPKFRMLGENMFVLDEPAPRPLIVEYYRHPRLLSDAPKDSDELDGGIEVQMLLPYYVAAQLVMLDNAFAYSALLNEFEAGAQRLIELPRAEVGAVEDVYSPGWDGDARWP